MVMELSVLVDYLVCRYQGTQFLGYQESSTANHTFIPAGRIANHLMKSGLAKQLLSPPCPGNGRWKHPSCPHRRLTYGLGAMLHVLATVDWLVSSALVASLFLLQIGQFANEEG